MNDLHFRSNDIRQDGRHPNDDERQPGEAVAAALESVPPRHTRTRSIAITTLIIIVFWLLYYAGISAMVAIESPNETRNLYVPRAFVSLAGVLISFGMIFVQDRLRCLSLRAAVAVIMAIIAPVIHFAINTLIFDYFFPRQTPGLPSFSEFAQDYLLRLWIFGTVSGIILAMSYAAEIREREKRISALQALAHSAQLRALRNQLNPHFLFNALNSVAGLISANRIGEAETMTENLADFLRLTLALDPQKLITVDEELTLQGLYLDIEKARFPDRLQVHVEVPRDLRSALVPSLITQPLIENAIKYAVARSTQPVELRINAQGNADTLTLVVADTGGDADHDPAKGARLGLRNVGERIRMHYGEGGHFHAEPEPTGGFRNVIVIPLEMQQ